MAAAPAHVYVQYFIPYDGDVEEHPNVFLVRKPPRSLTLADVIAAFPLPGTYFFRAKQAYGKTHGACSGAARLLPLVLYRVTLCHPSPTPPPMRSVAGPEHGRRGGAGV